MTVSPDGTGFREKAYAEIRKALAGISPKIPVALDINRSALGRFLSDAQKAANIKTNVDNREAYAAILQLKERLVTLNERLARIPVGVDDKAAQARIAALLARLRTLTGTVARIRIGADASAGILKATAATMALEAATDRMAAASDRAVAAFRAEQEAAARLAAGAVRSAAALGGQKNAAGQAAKGAAEATAAQVLLGIAMGRTPPLIVRGNNALRAFGVTGGWLGGVFGALGTKITLFGGALDKVLPAWATHITVMHLAGDMLVELIAVWGGAAIAATAFGIAASDATQEVIRRMQNLHTAADATNQSMYPLTGSLEKLHDAVRPQVYQIFGDALEVIKAHTGDFQRIVAQTSPVVGQLAGRMTAALTTGHAFDIFTKNAADSLKGLGNSFGNVFGAIGNILNVVPDYAQKLLSFGVVVTGLIENFTRLIEPVLRWGLALHGAFIYIGLATTLAVAFYTKALVPMAVGFAAAIKGAIGYAAALADLAVNEDVAAVAGLALSDVPVVFWVGLVAAAITGLVLLLRHSSDATKGFTDNLIKTADGVPVIQSLSANMSAQRAIAAQLSAAQQKLASTQEYVTATNRHADGAVQVVSQAYRDQKGVVDTLSAGLRTLQQQRALETSRLDPLAKKYGGMTAALGILNEAGITTAQVAKDQGQAWVIDQVQIQGTIDGYRAMTGTAGQLNNDLDVLGRTVTDQYNAVQKLNQAWGSFISDVTSTQSTFDTLALGMVTLDQNFQQAGGSGETLKNTLGKLSVTTTLTGASMDGLTQASLDLNQAFTTQISNADKLFASWRTAGLANNLFTQGVKDAIIPLVKYASGSAEATAQLVALAQEAGYHGTGSLRDLTQWLGAAAVKSDAFTTSVKKLLVPLVAANKGAKDATKQMLDLAKQAGYTGGKSMKDLIKWMDSTSGATADLKKITDQATQQEALLTGAMQAQGDAIANKLIGDINTAILAYFGVAQAATAYGDAIAGSGKSSDAAHAALRALIADLVAAGTASGTSKNAIAAMIAKIAGVSMQDAIKLMDQLPNSAASLAAAAKKASGTLDRTFIKSLQQIGFQSPSINKDVQAFSNQLLTSGDSTTKTQRARDKLIKDLMAAGIQADAAKSMVKNLQGEIDKLKGKSVNVNLTTSGTGQIIIKGTGINQRTINTTTGNVGTNLGGHTVAPYKGWLVSQGTTPTADDVTVRVSRGELIVPASMVKAGAVDHLRGAIPGFAAGGMAGSPPGYAAGGPVGAITNAVTQVSQAHAQWGQQAAVDFAQAAVKAAQAAAAAAAASSFTPGKGASGSAAQAQAYALSILPGGWSWPALVSLWNRESGWNANAVNPSSGAYGIPQALPAAWDHPYALGDYANQVRWGLAYIAGRYGSSQSAWAHELSFNWYDRGGTLKPGLTLAYNGTGRPEQVLPPGGAGHVTIVIENHGVIGSEADMDKWLSRSIDRLARQGKLTYALRRSPSAP